MVEILQSAIEQQLLFALLFSFVAGFVIGVERESRGKYAGISTHCLVIAGSALFTSLSIAIEPTAGARVAAQIVTGVGFLGAGIILKDDSGKIVNLTTAASIWFSASIGMAIGFGWYGVAGVATLYALLIPRVPHLTPIGEGIHHDK